MKGLIKITAWLMIVGGIGFGGFLCLVFLAPMSHVNSSGASMLGGLIGCSFLVALVGWVTTRLLKKHDADSSLKPDQ